MWACLLYTSRCVSETGLIVVITLSPVFSEEYALHTDSIIDKMLPIPDNSLSQPSQYPKVTVGLFGDVYKRQALPLVAAVVYQGGMTGGLQCPVGAGRPCRPPKMCIRDRFYNTIRNTIKNALFMAIRHLPYTVVMVLIGLCSLLLLFIDS